MANKNKQKQGKILLLLSNRSKIKKEDIAKGLDIHPSHLSKLFRSELLTAKVKKKAADFFAVDESVFDQDSDLLSHGIREVHEDSPNYQSKPIEDMTAIEVMRYLEEKDRRHYEERGRLLDIIENLTKK